MATEGINVNTSTADIPEPIVAPGSGVTDFDELETLEKLPKVAKEGKKTEPKKAEAKAEETPEGADDYEEQEKKPDQGKEKKEAKQTKPKKTYKVKSQDGTDLELLPDGVMDVLVDGKPIPVQVQELINNYSGKVAWEKRFSELDRDRKGFYSERDQLAQTVSRFYDLAVKNGDVLSALEHVAEAFQANPAEIREAYRKRLLESANQWQGKSQEEVQAELDRAELESMRLREKSRMEDQETGRIRSDLESRVTKVLGDTGAQPEEFREAYEDLKTHGVKDITPETVGEYLVELKARMSISETLKEVAPDLSREKFSAAMNELRETQITNGLSLEALKEVIQEVYGTTSKGVKLAKKLEKQGKQASVGSTKNFSHEPLNFDDI